MNKSWNGPCKSRRTWEGIFQDFGNCQDAPRGVFAREQAPELDEDIVRTLEEILHNSHGEYVETYD